MSINRLHNAKNPYQGEAKKVLCVCSAGLLRSPTTAWVLSNPPYNHNTRAVGLDSGHALIPMDEVLYHWADEIVVMNSQQKIQIQNEYGSSKQIISLEIEDSFSRMDTELINLIKERYPE